MRVTVAAWPCLSLIHRTALGYPFSIFLATLLSSPAPLMLIIVSPSFIHCFLAS